MSKKTVTVVDGNGNKATVPVTREVLDQLQKGTSTLAEPNTLKS